MSKFDRFLVDSFNTQPPEGGWTLRARLRTSPHGFNTQPPEGGWTSTVNDNVYKAVSTHSRPKAAGLEQLIKSTIQAGFNTQPPEGGWFLS